MGFTVFSDEAIGPVKRMNTPVQIKNTDDPSQEGTCISIEHGEEAIRGIAGKEGFCSFDVEKYLMNTAVGFGRDFLDIFARRKLKYEHTPSGIDTMSVILEYGQIQGQEDKLIKEIDEKLEPDKTGIQRDLALIAVVGEGMKDNSGMVTLKMSTCLHKKKINFRNVGSSDSSIIIGVDNEYFKRAMDALYQGMLKE